MHARAVGRVDLLLLALDDLDPVDADEEVSQRAPSDRHVRVELLVLAERREAAVLEVLLGRVVGEHAVEVERDAQLLARLVRERRVQDVPGGQPEVDGVADGPLVGREEEVDVQRSDELVRAAALAEHGPRDVEVVVTDRAHDAQTRLRRVARHDDDLDERVVDRRREVVQREQAADEAERDARSERVVAVPRLEVAVRGLALRAEHAVGVGQVEQCGRGDADDEAA